MKKIIFTVLSLMFLAASCNSQTSIYGGSSGIKSPGPTSSTTPQKTIAPPSSPTNPKLPTIKPPPGNFSSENSNSIQNNTSTIQTSSSSSYTYIHNNSTIIQNSGTSSNTATSLNLKLDSSAFPKATVGQAYAASFNFQQAGNQQIQVVLTGLPPGLGLVPSGTATATLTNPGPTPSLTLSGTPTEAGDYNVTVKLDNQTGTVMTSQFTLTIK